MDTYEDLVSFEGHAVVDQGRATNEYHALFQQLYCQYEIYINSIMHNQVLLNEHIRRLLEDEFIQSSRYNDSRVIKEYKGSNTKKEICMHNNKNLFDTDENLHLKEEISVYNGPNELGSISTPLGMEMYATCEHGNDLGSFDCS